jgi:histidinol-phosphate aminotransferase
LEKLCRAQKGVVILDEAYVDFAEENAMKLALKFPHVIVARTFSKAYSLCFQRVGYFVGNAELITALHKIRDSYNVNGLAQIAAEATLDDLDYYRTNFKKIIPRFSEPDEFHFDAIAKIFRKRLAAEIAR